MKTVQKSVPPSQTAPVKLRVALFTGNYNYIKDGVALTLNRLVKYLLSQGVEVLIFAPTGPKPAFESVGEVVSVPAFPIPFRPEYLLATGLPKSVRQRLEAFKPNLFHIAIPDILGYQALQLANKWQVPVVSSYHTRFDTYLDFYNIGFFKTLGQRYLRRFYQQCRQVYPPSESMAEIISAAGYSNDIRIWSRGVETDKFNPSFRDLAWRRSMGIADHELIVNFTSRIVKEKNIELFASVLEKLKTRGIAYRVLIVGDGPERKNFQNMLPAAVFTGVLGGSELARAYASSDVFFFPSESETFGNVTLEASASGLPCVCADATGSRSIVVHEKTGFLIDCKTPEVFVEKLGQLLTDAPYRAAMGKAAQEHAKTFSWDTIMAGLLANYYDAVATPLL